MQLQLGKRYGWQLFVALLAGLAGCAASQPPQVVSVATHDLGCDQVDVSEVAQDRYAAYGCGRGAVYARVCDGQSCRWGRLRHGHEESVAAGSQAPAPQREILPAPMPEPREVLPAPAAPQREVLPAPAPGSAAPAASDASAAQNSAPAQPAVQQQPFQDSALQPGATDANNAPVALSQGYLSDPYQAQVPAQPIAQQVMYPPPAPLVETRPYPPARNYAWIGGYWWWGPSNWVWVPGYWGAPYLGCSYIAGSWYWGAGYWNYSPGGWARYGSTVIIHRGFPSRPSTSVTVRAFTPYRAVHPGYGAGGGHRVVQTSGGYRPQGSPLYPSSNRGVVRAAPSGGYGYGGGSSYRGTSGYSGSPGRVVQPNSSVRAPASFGSSYRAPTRSYGSSGPTYRSSPSYGSGGGRSYSGGGHSYGGGGGGRSYSGGGGGGHSYGGGGGGGRSMGSVRVGGGGGGGGGHRR